MTKMPVFTHSCIAGHLSGKTDALLDSKTLSRIMEISVMSEEETRNRYFLCLIHLIRDYKARKHMLNRTIVPSFFKIDTTVYILVFCNFETTEYIVLRPLLSYHYS